MSDDVVRAASVRLLVDDVTDADVPSFALPTGTVTFLLTDIEGSSRRWEDAPDAMAVAVPRHYAILDEAIARHGGVRPVEQGEGDSVVGAFSRASDAVAAALDAQRTLTAEPWPAGAVLRVRMAIHTGEAQLRDEGNYFGQTVIRCARLRAIGHGAQVVLSDASAALVADRLPESSGLADLGTHRLKDLGRPERVWQLVHPDLPRSFGALRSLDTFRHNLPVQLTPLIGRGDEVVAVGGLLAHERLVTLTGSGGVGKTRLAMAVAADVIDRFSGVWLVELAGVNDDAGVAAAALAAVGGYQARGVPLVDQLAMELADGPCLVVLDNCEHLADTCAELVVVLLAANPTVTVVATSREPLGVPGEVIWRVPSLGVPPAETILAVPVLSQYDAVLLFVDRAQRARPSFTVSEANAPAIAQICHRLDGIPLALELAAARCRQMSAERIAHDLDDRFRFLTGGARTVLPRHQTLAASIDWSHDRLDGSEEIVFRRLGVFAGPFPLEAAEAVAAAAADIEAVAVYDLVSRLVDKSLVLVVDGPDGEPRYRLLETLRAYALNRARAAGELTAIRQAHALWWLWWLDENFSAIHTDALVDQVEAFHDNLKAALDWSLDEPAIGLRLLGRLGRPWQNSGRPGDALAAVDRLLTDDNAERYGPDWMATANRVAVLVMTARGYSAALPLLQTSQRLARSMGDPYHAAIAEWLSDFTVERCVVLRDLAHERQDSYVEALATIALAEVNVDADPAAAAGQLDAPEVVAAARESSYLLNFANRTRATAAWSTGDLKRCLGLARDLASSRSTLMVDSAVNVLSAAALLAADGPALSLAVEIAERRLRKTPGTARTADLAAHRQALLDGGHSVQPDLQANGDPLSPPSMYLAAREAIDAGAGDLMAETARGQIQPTPHGRAVLAAIEAAASADEAQWHTALQHAVDHDLRPIAVDALEGLAVAAAAAESWAECLHLCFAAERLRDETGYRWRFPSEQAALNAAITAAQTGLTPDAAATAVAAGRVLDWREATAYAQRARGARKRPHHGWASLTPTEQQVVALVAEGLTNPQIGERLLMGRATVKTHLEHIFVKTAVHTRSELAAEYTQRRPIEKPAGQGGL